MKRVFRRVTSLLLSAGLLCACGSGGNTAEGSNDRNAAEGASETMKKDTETEEMTAAETASAEARALDADGQYVFDVPETFMGVYISPGPEAPLSEDIEGADFTNFVFVSGFNDFDFSEQVRQAVGNGNCFWINTQFLETGIHENDDGVREMGVRDDWQERMRELTQIVRDEKAWNYFLGFYMDEPLLNRFSAERVYELSKYNHDTFGKRYFICFSVEEIVPSEYSDGVAYGKMTKDYSVYVTDAAYDMYWDYDEWSAKYKSINKKMKKELPDDCRIWYVPWAFSYQDKSFEDVAALEPKLLTHLNAMYAFLQEEEHKGGLVTFCWRGAVLGFYGMEEMLEAGKWTAYYDRYREIGRELCGTDRLP